MSYDGTNYAGFQIQENALSIQGVLEKALKKIHKGQAVRIYASGRTDAGVHAYAQVFHFETNLKMPEENWQRAFNAVLPHDMYIHHIEKVSPDFHSRFDAVEKEYHYYILNQKMRDVFRKNYTYFVPYELDIAAMERACQHFLGEHDFTACCSMRTGIKGSKVRKLTKVSLEKRDNELRFILRGNGFLYNMVRIIVGTILEVGLGKRNEAAIPDLLLKKDRTTLGPTVPAQGLYLFEVAYPEGKSTEKEI